jgi:hypothetical protein
MMLVYSALVEILGFRMLALIKSRALILPYLQQKSAVYSPYWVSGTGRCGQDAELALAVRFGRRT